MNYRSRKLFWSCAISFLLIFSFGELSARDKQVKTPVDYVEPRIDSHKSRWFLFFLG